MGMSIRRRLAIMWVSVLADLSIYCNVSFFDVAFLLFLGQLN